jgi:hypothetical protein
VIHSRFRLISFPSSFAVQQTNPPLVCVQMVWEQGSQTIVMLTRLMESGSSLCHRYWPDGGSQVHGAFEVHLVSEHIWCEDYLVRSLLLKNLKTNETRTVTQFHFLSWPEKSVPTSTKAIRDFRRYVVSFCTACTVRAQSSALLNRFCSRSLSPNTNLLCLVDDSNDKFGPFKVSIRGNMCTLMSFACCLPVVAAAAFRCRKAITIRQAGKREIGPFVIPRSLPDCTFVSLFPPLFLMPPLSRDLCLCVHSIKNTFYGVRFQAASSLLMPVIILSLIRATYLGPQIDECLVKDDCCNNWTSVASR